MTCNAWNHPANCCCGFSGDGSQGGFAGSVFGARPLSEFRRSRRRSTSLCPICGDEVYFIRHNGGCMWFDDLGHPWPKHPCFRDEPGDAERRDAWSAGVLAGRICLSDPARFGADDEEPPWVPNEQSGLPQDDKSINNRMSARLSGLMYLMFGDTWRRDGSKKNAKLVSDEWIAAIGSLRLMHRSISVSGMNKQGRLEKAAHRLDNILLRTIEGQKDRAYASTYLRAIWYDCNRRGSVVIGWFATSSLMRVRVLTTVQCYAVLAGLLRPSDLPTKKVELPKDWGKRKR